MADAVVVEAVALIVHLYHPFPTFVITALGVPATLVIEPAPISEKIAIVNGNADASAPNANSIADLSAALANTDRVYAVPEVTDMFVAATLCVLFAVSSTSLSPVKVLLGEVVALAVMLLLPFVQ